ncbi:MAG: restriction endonuclease subunit S [Vibrio sp.]|uniref:restriction endonuclease subunit S n=1 Tax=Vibrio sp. TaxID=678 RepID=UPI003A84212D
MSEAAVMATEKQAVPQGYKQTEVGVIPEDWIVMFIDDCAVKVGSGKTPTGGAAVYVDAGRPFIRSQNVDRGKLDLSDVAFITDAVHSTFIGTELKEDDVLLNITGASIGRCSKADRRIIGGNVNQHVCIIRTDDKKLLPKLLVELINSSIGQNQIDSYQAGGNREGLNFSQVRQLTFSISADITEQTAIANALSDMDALLSELEQLIAKKQAIKTATMQQLLTGKTRLPQFTIHTDGEHKGQPKGMKPSELGEIPEDWEVEPLGALLSDNPKYGINAAAVPLSGNLPVYIRITDISEDGYFKPTKKVGVNSPFSDMYKLKSGDIVLARTGASVGKSYLYQENDGELVFAGFLIKISPDQKRLSSEFLSHFLKTNQYWNWVTVNSMRSGQPGINSNQYKSLQLALPKIHEQTAIANILSDMDAEIQALEQRLAKTRQIKQGMMQELLTGKTRLPVKAGD